MPSLHMVVGISGSGKSFIAKDIKKTWENKTGVQCDIHSSDAIRKELWGSEEEQQNPSLVFQILGNRVMKSLKEGRHCVYDATNLSAKRRRAFLNLLSNSKIECRTYCHIVVAPVELCLKRDSERERTVGKEVIYRQMKNFEVPYFNEGWDQILIQKNFVVKDFPTITELFNELAADKELNEHDNPHHSYTISEHCFETVACLQTTDAVVTIAAWYHDIGKYFTKTYVDRKGKISEVAHYYDHQKVGAYIYLVHGDYIPLEVAFLIQHHMDRYFYSGEKMSKLYAEIPPLMGTRLIELMRADEVAH